MIEGITAWLQSNMIWIDIIFKPLVGLACLKYIFFGK